MKRKAYLRPCERYARRGKAFVYVDESGFAPCVSRRYGYGPKGKRVYGPIAGKKYPHLSSRPGLGNALKGHSCFKALAMQSS